LDTIEFLNEQLRQSRAFLEGTLSNVAMEHFHAPPPGALNPIAATLAHLATGEDGFVNGLIRGGAPLFATTWSGKTGLSELPPEGADWAEWARELRIDIDAFRRYAAAVCSAAEQYIASLTPADLDRAVDLSALGFGQQTLGWVLGAGVLGHVLSHWGEICALNGLQGGRGFPR
jgi:hypothetical protein